jgi:hypothetical protein
MWLLPSLTVASTGSPAYFGKLTFLLIARLTDQPHRVAFGDTERKRNLMSNVSPEGLSARVRNLESQNRLWKLSSLLLFLILVVSLARGLMAQGTPPNHPITIEAQTFLLRDTNGNVRGKLAMKEDQPTLELYDPAGKVVWSTGLRAELK